MSFDVKSVFVIPDDEARDILLPFYTALSRTCPDVLLYHSGPVVSEIKDRNVVVVSDRDKYFDIAKQFGVGIIALSRSCTTEQAISAIKREAEKGSYNG